MRSNYTGESDLQQKNVPRGQNFVSRGQIAFAGPRGNFYLERRFLIIRDVYLDEYIRECEVLAVLPSQGGEKNELIVAMVKRGDKEARIVTER